MQGDYEVSKVQAVVILRLPASKVLDINTGWGSDTKPRTQHQGPVQGLCDEAVCDTAHRLNVGGTSFRTTEITLRQNMESKICEQKSSWPPCPPRLASAWSPIMGDTIHKEALPLPRFRSEKRWVVL